MNNLDIVMILGSGVERMDFCQSVLDSRKNPKDRLMWYVPCPYDKDSFDKLIENPDSKIMSWYSQFTDAYSHKILNKNIDPKRLEDWYREIQRRPYFCITPPTPEAFVKNPINRLSDDSKPEHSLLLVDDLIGQGHTLRTAVSDFVSMGYDKNKIVFYSARLSDTDYPRPYNANPCPISDSEFREFLKN